MTENSTPNNPTPATQARARIEDFGLIQHMTGFLGVCATNRTIVEARMDRNYAMYVRESVLDRKGQFKQGDQNRDVAPDQGPEVADRSEMYHDIGKQKVVAASGIIMDVRYRGGRAPLMLVDETMPADAEKQIEMGKIARMQQPEQRAAMQENPEAGAVDMLLNRKLALDLNQEMLHRINEVTNGQNEDELASLFGGMYGVMIQKFVVDEITQTDFVVLAPGVVEPRESTVKLPRKIAVDPWNLFWDMNVDYRDSELVIECNDIDAYTLRKKIGEPGWIEANITALLDGYAPGTRQKDMQEHTRPALKPQQQTRQNIRKREAWGRFPRESVEKLEAELARVGNDGQAGEIQPSSASPGGISEARAAGDDVYAHIVTAENMLVRFIRCKRSDIPYEVEFFELKAGGIGGFSVMDNMEMHQRVLNGLVQSLEETAKVVSQFILAGKRRNMQTKFKRLNYGLFIDLDEDCEDVGEAIKQVMFDGDIAGLLAAIEMMLKLAHQASCIPESTQGLDPTMEQTFQEFQARLQHAGAYLAGPIRRVDAMDERMYTRWLHFMMLQEDNPVPRGNYRVQALGFTSFQNRFTRAQTLISILQLVLSNQVLLAMSKIEWLYREVLKSQDIDPAQVIKTQSELMEEAEVQKKQLEALQAQVGSQDGGATPDQTANIALTQARIALLEQQARLAASQTEATTSKALVERARALHQISGAEKTPPANGAPAAAPA